MAFIAHTTNHLVKSEDLNHHGTLFAGRCAEWVVEAGFIAVAYELRPQSVVCLNLHGIEFKHPVKAGVIATFTSQIVRTGRSTITVYVEIRDCRHQDTVIASGYISFCYVDENTRSIPHGLNFVPSTEHEKELNAKAIEIYKNSLQK